MNDNIGVLGVQKGPEQELKPKTIELMIKEISSQIYEFEQTVNRLAGIEERLQGPRPEEPMEDIGEPSGDHLTMLNHQIERFKITNRSAESLISIIEVIL